jgi:purine nucleosidase
MGMVMRSWVAALLGVVSVYAFPAQARPELIIYDNDWTVSNGGYVAEPSLMLLLGDPDKRLLGLTTVSGDFWRDEGATTLLRFLEIVGAARQQVINGAIYPLVNTASRHAQWQKDYGPLPWSGAWNTTVLQKDAHNTDPYKIIPPKEGMPKLKVITGSAAAFMIGAVRAHPHEVTLYAEGPLTNVALALRLDPQFANLLGRIVIQGSNATGDHDEGGQPIEFNFAFDPEAADIVLSAPWHDILVIGDASNHNLMTPVLLERLRKIDTPAARFAVSNAAMGLPLWSELGAAIIADPAIVTKSVQALIEVDISHGRLYGSTRSWPVDSSPPGRPGLRAVRIVTAIDQRLFIDGYVAALAKDVRFKRGAGER